MSVERTMRSTGNLGRKTRVRGWSWMRGPCWAVGIVSLERESRGIHRRKYSTVAEYKPPFAVLRSETQLKPGDRTVEVNSRLISDPRVPKSLAK